MQQVKIFRFLQIPWFHSVSSPRGNLCVQDFSNFTIFDDNTIFVIKFTAQSNIFSNDNIVDFKFWF